MAIIRARQRVITALTPHQGNRRFIVPKRGIGAAPTQKVYTLTAGTLGTYTGLRRDASRGALDPDETFNGHEVNWVFGRSDTQNLEFRLTGTGKPDTDATFKQFTLQGTFTGGAATQTYVRADRDVYNASVSGGTLTLWQWNGVYTSQMIFGNDYTFTVDWE